MIYNVNIMQIQSNTNTVYLERALQQAQSEARSAHAKANSAEQALRQAEQLSSNANNDASKADTKVTLSELGIQMSKIPESAINSLESLNKNISVNTLDAKAEN